MSAPGEGQRPTDTVYDFAAIGLGPFNLGLACLTHPIAELDGVFLEARPEFDWHGGMLLEDSTLQTPFMSDLVTLADPTSPFSFLNYLKECGRLYPFYIRENFYPLRSEYNDYCRWAAAQLPNVVFGQRVTAVEHDDREHLYRVRALDPSTEATTTYRARRLVLGTGTPPYVPESCRDLGGDVLHNSEYLSHREVLQKKRSITIIGSGQSAAEIYYDLLRDIDRAGYELTWITRSPRFFPLEYTKLTLELTSPEYADHFHALPRATRDQLVMSQKALYKGIDSSLINDIFDLLYTKSRVGAAATQLLTSSALTEAVYDPVDGSYSLRLHHEEEGEDFFHTTEGLVLATGYRYQTPEFLAPVENRIVWDEVGRFDVRRNYTIDVGDGEIFVQNAELHTHGFVAPDLGMAAYRNSCIIRAMLGREYYPIERSIAFQQFGAPASDRQPTAGASG